MLRSRTSVHDVETEYDLDADEVRVTITPNDTLSDDEFEAVVHRGTVRELLNMEREEAEGATSV